MRAQTSQGWYDVDSTKQKDYGALVLIKRNVKTCTACKYTKKSARPSWLIFFYMYLASALNGLSEQLW